MGNTAQRNMLDNSALSTKNKIQKAILGIPDPNLRAVFRSQLKELGFKEIHSPSDTAATVNLLKQVPDALLIMNWERDPVERAQILTAAQGKVRVDTRPIYLVATSISKELILAGSEYNVARIQTGDMSSASIETYLQSILEEETRVGGLRDGLRRVAEARLQQNYSQADMVLRGLIQTFPSDPYIMTEMADN